MWRCTIVTLVKIPAILSGNLLVGHLRTDGSHAPLVQRCLLLRGGPDIDTAVSAVIAHAVDRYIVDDCSVDVHISDDGGVYVAHSCVVVETITAPVAAFISTAVIAEAVVHTPVETDMRSPVSGMPRVAATTPAPVTWCPQQTVAGCNDPGSEPSNSHIRSRPSIRVSRCNLGPGKWVDRRRVGPAERY